MKNLTTCLFLFVVVHSFGATVTWDGGAGTDNWGDASNWDSNALPGLFDDVVIPFQENAILNISASIQSLTLAGQNIFTTNANSTLSLSGSQNFAIELINISEIRNNGGIHISNFDGTGVKVNAGSILRSTGELEIITISNGHGIDNRGTVEINSGYLLIDEVVTSGFQAILNDGSGDLVNNARISINDINGVGIKNDGISNMITNTDSLIITNTVSNGIENFGDFNNNANAVVLISHVTVDHGILSSPTSSSFGIFNHGRIEISHTADDAIECRLIVNSDSIIIDSISMGHGIDLIDSLYNSSSGGIIVSNILDNSKIGIYQSHFAGEVDNQGHIEVSNCEGKGIEIEGDMYNSGLVFVHDCNDKGFVNNTLLENLASGEIIVQNIHGTSSEGFFNANFLGRVYNHGSIDISLIHDTIGLINKAVFENYGVLNISETKDFGLFNNRLMLNEGTINIDQIDSVGLENGKIGGAFIGDFNQSGSLKITSTTGSSFRNTSIFEIDSCGSMEVDGALEIFSDLVNHGYLLQEYNGNNFIIGGTLTNLGVYIERYGRTFNEANFVNTGMYIKGLSSPITCQEAIDSFYYGPNSANITAQANVSSDENGVHLIGTANLASNQVNLNASSSGIEAIYVQLTLPGNCDYYAPIYLSQILNCGGTTNQWIGNASNNWFNTGNWSLNHVPLNTEEVVIPSGSTVIIENGSAAVARIISVDMNVDFTIDGTIEIAGN